jgi:hypothetical protein
MRFTLDYSRVAARPFPFTDQMRRIIDESMNNLQKLLKSSDWIDWGRGVEIFKGTIDTEVGEFVLRVKIRHDSLNEECFGGVDFDYLKAGRIEIYLGKRIKGLSEDILNSRDFWLDIKTVLHHELIHAFDPKNLKVELVTKWKYYPSYDRYMYFRNPTEVSAFEGSLYHYFQNKAESGVGLQESVRDFLTSGYRRNERGYMESIKPDKVRWRKYLERIYKSAQQAYSDFNRG